MKRFYANHLVIFCLCLSVFAGCSRADTTSETNKKEALVQIELSFSGNYASYSWLMGFQLISSSDNVTVSGHSWDESIHPEEFATWLNATEDTIMSSQYWMETTEKVSAVTFNGTAELLQDAENSEPLFVTVKIYAEGVLIKASTTVFEPNVLNYLTVIVSSEDF